MTEDRGLGAGAVVIHVLVTVLLGALVAERLAAGGGIHLSPELTGALGLTVVGVVSAVLFKWRQGRASTGLTTGQMLAERLAEVERREAGVDAVHARLAELEERLDFSERMLAHGRPAEPAERERNR